MRGITLELAHVTGEPIRSQLHEQALTKRGVPTRFGSGITSALGGVREDLLRLAAHEVALQIELGERGREEHVVASQVEHFTRRRASLKRAARNFRDPAR